MLVCVPLPPPRWPGGFQDPHWGRLGPLQDLVLKAGDPGSGASPAPHVRRVGREAPPLSCAVSPQGSFRTSAGSKAPPTPAPEVQRPVQAAKKESKEPKKVTHSPSWAGVGAHRPSLCRGDDSACDDGAQHVLEGQPVCGTWCVVCVSVSTCEPPAQSGGRCRPLARGSRARPPAQRVVSALTCHHWWVGPLLSLTSSWRAPRFCRPCSQ